MPPENEVERDLLDFDDLTAVERWQIQFVRRSFASAPANRVIRILQRHFSANWVDISTRNLLHVRGAERLPGFGIDTSTILVSNHRSFFDLYVVSSFLLKRGVEQRLMFPVRTKFFYDSPLGLAVNGAMSIFAMYPPLFRDRDRVGLNRASVSELIRLLRAGGTFVGLHPEGMRNKNDDPYTFLPARPGAGRIIHGTRGRATVVPVFINGLGNDLARQVVGNYLRNGAPITIVFGEPVHFGTMLDEPASPELDQRISEHALAAVHALGEEERELRATLPWSSELLRTATSRPARRVGMD